MYLHNWRTTVHGALWTSIRMCRDSLALCFQSNRFTHIHQLESTSTPRAGNSSSRSLMSDAYFNDTESCWFCEYATFHNEVTTAPLSLHTDAKFLVYTCEDAGCGGLGDRISGLLSAFYLAVALQRVFFDRILSPSFRLEETLVPRYISWHRRIDLKKPETVDINLVDSQDKGKSLEQIEKVRQVSSASTQTQDQPFLAWDAPLV